MVSSSITDISGRGGGSNSLQIGLRPEVAVISSSSFLCRERALSVQRYCCSVDCQNRMGSDMPQCLQQVHSGSPRTSTGFLGSVSKDQGTKGRGSKGHQLQTSVKDLDIKEPSWPGKQKRTLPCQDPTFRRKVKGSICTSPGNASLHSP